MSAIRFERAEHPMLSVVMVTYGGGAWAERSLRALAERTAAPFEVTVVDNASPDGTADRLAQTVVGATLIRSARNIGFAAGANRGAAHARAPFVCFLNPDALVEAGWEAALLHVLDDPSVAAAVPRLLDPDGRLQEAGSLVGRDGYTWALGHDAGDAEDPRFRFPLDVDYGSACLLVRRSAFCEVGGFDPIFFPAYGEDVDLCLSLRERGYRIRYEPAATVRHVRSVSLGVGGAERWIHRSRAILVERWGARLRERSWLAEPAYFPHRVAAVRDHDRPDRILVVADQLDGEDGIANLASHLGQVAPDARVTVAVEERPVASTLDHLAERGIEVVHGARDWPSWFESRRYQASAVVAATGRFDGEIARTQPQAPRVPVDVVAAEPAAALAASGVASTGAGR